MKKITLNEELSRIQEMMGVTHVNSSNKDTVQEVSPTDIVNTMREEETDENEEILDKFKDQYGDEKGEKVYYATANKQDRDPETFEKNEEVKESWDLAMEGTMVDSENRIDYLENALKHVWNMGKGNNTIDLKSMAQSLVNDMFGEKEEEPDYKMPGYNDTMDALDNLGIREEESWMKMRAGKDGKVYENEDMEEARGFQQETYFDTQARALESAEEYAKHKGYSVNWESVNPEHVGYGQTVKYSVALSKDNVPAKKMLQISLYRMESGKYELTNYIN